MMNHDAASEEWKKLYGLAKTFVEKKPWTYLDNENLIQISPVSLPRGYFSVLGAGGYQFGCLLYLGEEGFNDYLCVLNASCLNISMEYANVHQNCLAMFLGDRDEVSEEQYRIIKNIGLRSRGKGDWIYFDRYETGYMPSLLNPADVKTMTIYLEAMLKALDRMESERISLDTLQIYSFVEQENQWVGSIEAFPQNTYLIPACQPMNDISKARIKKTSKSRHRAGGFDFLMDYFMSAVAESPKDKPYMPLWIGVGDSEMGMVMDFVLINPEENVYEAVWGLLERCIEKYGVPSIIFVENEIASSMLEQFCLISGIDLEESGLALREFFDEMQSGIPMMGDESEEFEGMVEQLDKVLEQFDWKGDLEKLFESDFNWKMGYSEIELKNRKEKIQAIEAFFGLGTLNGDDFEGYERRIEFTRCYEDWKKGLNNAYKKDLQEYADVLGAEVKGSYGKDMLISMILSILADYPERIHRLLTKSEERMISYISKRAEKTKSELPMKKFKYSEAELIHILKMGIIDISLECNGDILYLIIELMDSRGEMHV